MNVTQTSAEGLRHEFKVVVPAAELNQRVDAKLSELSGRVRLPGFRPGKVPMKIVKKRFGRSVLGEVLEQTVSETSQKTVSDRSLRPAMQPKIEVTSFSEGGDLVYTMAVEVMPTFELGEFSDIALERLTAEVEDEVVDASLERLARTQRTYTPVAEPRPAAEGDQLLIDFRGTVDGEAREGMASEGFELVLGSSQFIPGFEDQLTGASAGDHVTVTVTFPDPYPSADLAGREAVFEVDVHEVREAADQPVDDELAKRFGMESLDDLKSALKEQTAREYQQVSRTRIKRQLLDILSERYTFDVPAGMVDLEFQAIWKQVEQAIEAGEDDPDLQKPEEELREEYRRIAERRVRLGLLLSEVGQRNSITVAQDELNRAVVAEARKYPGQEQKVFEYLRDNPQALEGIRAPLFEEKVVDFILELAKVEERRVSVEELMRDPDEPAPAAEAGEEAPAKAAKPKARSRAKAKAAEPEEAAPAAEAAPAGAEPAEAASEEAASEEAEAPVARKAPAKKAKGGGKKAAADSKDDSGADSTGA